VTRTRALRAGASALLSVFFCLESGCSTGQPTNASSSASPPPLGQAPPSSPIKENLSSSSEILRARAWDQTRRFKALFKAEVSPKVGAIGRGYLSVWWDGPTGTLTWRASAPIAGSGRGGILRKGERGGDSPLPGNLDPTDLISCILGAPADGSTRSALLDNQGRVVEMSFPKSEIVSFQPGEGGPRRIEANGPDGRAVLTLESYSSWPASEEVPPL
jgi:hypothetical protein